MEGQCPIPRELRIDNKLMVSDSKGFSYIRCGLTCAIDQLNIIVVIVHGTLILRKVLKHKIHTLICNLPLPPHRYHGPHVLCHGR
jgi:hypothetical protein